MRREREHHSVKDPARVLFDDIHMFLHPVRGGAGLRFPAPDTGAQEEDMEELGVHITELLHMSAGDEHHRRAQLFKPAELKENDKLKSIHDEISIRERNRTE